MRTTSTSGISGTGLKKCRPTKRSGRAGGRAAISAMVRLEVLEAKMVGGGQSGVERAPELVLELEVLGDRLDDEVAVAEVGELGGER